jgi:hypothetical protein
VNRVSAIVVTVAVGFVASAQQANQPPRRREVTAEGRQKIENAIPSQAPAKPRKPRKLLVVDYGGYHPSVPYANLAVELMGIRTGAYQGGDQSRCLSA